MILNFGFLNCFTFLTVSTTVSWMWCIAHVFCDWNPDLLSNQLKIFIINPRSWRPNPDSDQYLVLKIPWLWSCSCQRLCMPFTLDLMVAWYSSFNKTCSGHILHSIYSTYADYYNPFALSETNSYCWNVSIFKKKVWAKTIES